MTMRTKRLLFGLVITACFYFSQGAKHRPGTREAIAPALLIGAGMAAGGLMGRKKGDSDAMKFLQMAYDEFGRLRPPTPEEMKYQVQSLVQQGVLTPEDAQTVLANPSAYLNVDEDPTIRKAQLGSLSKLQGIVDSGGLDAQGKADVADIINSLNTANKGSREAIVENAAQRGVGGSGLELANRMSAGQEASTNASQQGLDAAALAEKRALEAIMNTGQLAGQIRGQDYTKASDKAAAMDAIDKFNTQNKQNVILTNTAARNSAQATNLGAKQRIADTNVAMANEKAKYDASLKQQDFENQAKIAAGKTGQLGGLAQTADKQKERDDAYWASLLGTGGTILAGAGK